MNIYVKTERLKNKRTAVERVLVVVPIFFIIFSVGLSGLMFGGSRGEYFMAVVYNWFPVIIIPIIVAILSSQIIEREKKNKCNQYLSTLNLSLGNIWWSKAIVVAQNLGIILLINYLLTAGMEFFVLHEEVNYLAMLFCTVVTWLGSLTIISISLFVAEKSNTLLVILMNFVMSYVGVVMAAESTWFLNPWSWSTRMTAPILGINPNGMFLEPTSELWNQQVVPIGVVLSIVFFILLSYLGGKAYQMGEKEVSK